MVWPRWRASSLNGALDRFLMLIPPVLRQDKPSVRSNLKLLKPLRRTRVVIRCRGLKQGQGGRVDVKAAAKTIGLRPKPDRDVRIITDPRCSAVAARAGCPGGRQRRSARS